ncbi:MAG: Hpt domain-containing protein [Pirellulaceae bacterium]
MDNVEQRFSLRHICMADALQYADQDHELLRQLAELFLSEGPNQIAAVNRSLDTGDYAQAARAAHTLKGSISALAAEAIHQRARQVESLLRRQAETGDGGQDWLPQWTHLQREVAELHGEAKQIADGLAS